MIWQHNPKRVCCSSLVVRLDQALASSSVSGPESGQPVDEPGGPVEPPNAVDELADLLVLHVVGAPPLYGAKVGSLPATVNMPGVSRAHGQWWAVLHAVTWGKAELAVHDGDFGGQHSDRRGGR